MIAEKRIIFSLTLRSMSLIKEFIKLCKLINYLLFKYKSTSKSSCISYESTYFNSTQCKSTLSTQKYPFSHGPNIFFQLNEKKCKYLLYLNTAFSFTNNAILQTLKWYLVQITKSWSIYNPLHSTFVSMPLNCPIIHEILSVGILNSFGCNRCIVTPSQFY